MLRNWEANYRPLLCTKQDGIGQRFAAFLYTVSTLFQVSNPTAKWKSKHARNRQCNRQTKLNALLLEYASQSGYLSSSIVLLNRIAIHGTIEIPSVYAVFFAFLLLT